jgi:hypothetical protein
MSIALHEMEKNALAEVSNYRLKAQIASNNGVIEEIGCNNLEYFSQCLSNEYDLDNYSTSPIYYALTGRDGLWLYHYNKTLVPFCVHPNVKNTILIFPPLGEKNYLSIPFLLQKIYRPTIKYKLARYKAENLSKLERISVFFPCFSFTRVTEQILDWKYPVHIISTQQLSQMAGRKFDNMRHMVHKASKLDVQIDSLSPKYLRAINKLSYRWTRNQTQDENEIDDLVSYYVKLIELMRTHPHLLDGLVYLIQDEICGVIIWSKPNPNQSSATAHAGLYDTTFKGLPEFAWHKASETLFAQGVKLVNIGGSETSGLDAFKRKFRAPHVLDICSFDITFSGNVIETPNQTMFDEVFHQI